MFWIPGTGRQRVQHNTGTVGSANYGTSVTTGGTSSTKGSATELISSSSFDTYFVRIMAARYAASATNSQGAMDIMIGGAGSEVVLIENLLMGFSGGQSFGNAPKVWEFPLFIPSGSRISARAAGARTTTAFRVGIWLHGGALPAFRWGTRVVTYGMGTVPAGTTIVPGASAAEGSWTQITASTTEHHFAFIPSFQFSGDDTTILGRTYTMDLGVGAAASEQMIHEGWWWQSDAIETMGGPINPTPCFHDVPSGSRLAMRVSCDNTLDGSYDAVIHAMSGG